jgi:hypothetical protein
MKNGGGRLLDRQDDAGCFNYSSSASEEKKEVVDQTGIEPVTS